MPQPSNAVMALAAITPLPITNENEVRRFCSQEDEFRVEADLATTTALAERVAIRARQKCRLVALNFCPASAVTGAATNFFTLLIDKRTTATPGTPINLVTYAADTATTDNAAAFGSKDLLASATFATYVPTATSADFNLEEGDVLTVEVTKAASGMTFPISTLAFLLEPRT
jgi:hypothetical protein